MQYRTAVLAGITIALCVFANLMGAGFATAQGGGCGDENECAECAQQWCELSNYGDRESSEIEGGECRVECTDAGIAGWDLDNCNCMEV
jgi:hypothetical protein